MFRVCVGVIGSIFDFLGLNIVGVGDSSFCCVGNVFVVSCL